MEALGSTLVIELARHLRGLPNIEKPKCGKLATWQLREITEYVNRDSGESPTIRELAQICGISRSHFVLRFKATTGITVHEFVTTKRIDRAKAYLGGSKLPLKEIAARLGFSQPSAFAFAFRKSVGVSPSQYRRESWHKPVA
jgi:AraC family transcriptional regulator